LRLYSNMKETKNRTVTLAAIAAAAASYLSLPASAFVPSHHVPSSRPVVVVPTGNIIASSSPSPSQLSASTEESASATTADAEPAPQFNGKTILPMRVLSAGLRGHKVAAVYAVLNSSYKKKKAGGDGWEHCEHVGITRDLGDALATHLAAHGKKDVAHVRAWSFAFPQRAVMEDMASQWRAKAADAGGNAPNMDWVKDMEAKDKAKREELIRIMEETAVFDDDDEDEDMYYNGEEEGDSSPAALFVDKSADAAAARDAPPPAEEANGEEIISPFASDANLDGSSDDKPLEFNKENVDKVLDEIRPYLISDGGNVAVDGVDVETKNVYLILEGACGSCPSSTVTMQMGIERVLKENFPGLGEVVQVEDPATAEAKPTELTLEAVQEELNRIRPAIQAMGGTVEIVSVDPLGVVKLDYRGSNKVKQGLELALRDVEFCKHVEFVSQ